MRQLLTVNLEDTRQIDNARLEYKDEDLSALMATMKAQGLLQPIGVKKLKGDKWGVIWGNRRVLAAKKLGWKTIEALEAENMKDEKSVMIAHLLENVCRAEVPLTDQGRYYETLRKEHKMSIQEIAVRVGTTKSKIDTAIALFQNVPPKHRASIRSALPGRTYKKGIIAGSAAKLIVSATGKNRLNSKQSDALYKWAQSDQSKEKQIFVMATLLKNGYTAKEAKKLCGNIKTVYIHIPFLKTEITKLERSTGKSINNLIYGCIAKNFHTLINKRSMRNNQQQLLGPSLRHATPKMLRARRTK